MTVGFLSIEKTSLPFKTQQDVSPNSDYSLSQKGVLPYGNVYFVFNLIVDDAWI